MPAITQPVVIDGYTEPGASPNTLARGTNANLLVELNGTNAGEFGRPTIGLRIETSDVVVRGLVINRFGSAGIRIFSESGTIDNVRIEGNFIGPDPSGTEERQGSSFGVDVLSGEKITVGGTLPEARNLISGSNADGVFINDETPGTRVLGNLIGTQRDGTSPLGNADEGVHVDDAERIIIGGTAPGAANTIAFNSDSGVLVSGTSSRSRILNNSIFANGGLGIDLVGPSESDSTHLPTPNDPDDADVGPNTLQNVPVIASVRTSSTATIIRGSLNSTPSKTFTIQFFSNPAGADAEGKKFIGQRSVTTDVSGDVSFFFEPQVKVRRGAVTATAINDSSGDTSEFSAPRKLRRV